MDQEGIERRRDTAPLVIITITPNLISLIEVGSSGAMEMGIEEPVGARSPVVSASIEGLVLPTVRRKKMFLASRDHLIAQRQLRLSCLHQPHWFHLRHLPRRLLIRPKDRASGTPTLTVVKNPTPTASELSAVWTHWGQGGNYPVGTW